MGCDIHLYIETLDSSGNATVVPGPLEDCEKCDGTKVDELGQQCPECKGTGKYHDQHYGPRNYVLFSALAGARGGKNNALTIQAPRGMPAGVCQEIQAAADHWGEDGHSHTWYMLDELLAYDWKGGRQKQAFVRPAQYLAWKATGQPEVAMAHIPLGDYCEISEPEMVKVIHGFTVDDAREPVVRVAWSTPLIQEVGEFIKKLEDWKQLGPPNFTRLVMWFDN
jgi:hypothetical protein